MAAAGGGPGSHTLTAPGLLNAGAGWPGPEHGVALPLAACWLLHAAQHSGTGFTVAEFLSVSQFTCGVQNVHELAKIAARWRFRVHGALEIASASLQVCCFVHASTRAADVCFGLQSEDVAGLETVRAETRFYWFSVA